MDFKANKTTLQNIFLFALFVLMLVLVIMIFKPFYAVILWSALLYIILRPLYKKIIDALNQKSKSYDFLRTLFAGVFAVGTVLIIGFLFYILGANLLYQFTSVLSGVENYFHENPTFLDDSELAIKTKVFLEKHGFPKDWLIDFDARNKILSLIKSYGSLLFSSGKIVIGVTSNFVISLVFAVFILFFFYLDGSYLANLLLKAMPINPEYSNKLLTKFSQVLVGLTQGYLSVALYQGISSFIIMKCFHVPSALLFSVLLMFASFIPMVGAALVWAPIGIIMCFSHSVLKGILFLAISGVVVSFLDNFLRPFFLKNRIKVHPLIIFFAILGGIKLFGFNGLILGPMIIIMFFTLLDILSTNGDEENGVQIESESGIEYNDEDKNSSENFKDAFKKLFEKLKKSKK